MLKYKGFRGNYGGRKGIQFILEMVMFYVGIFVYSVIMLLLISFILNSIIYLTFHQIILIAFIIAFVGTLGRMFCVRHEG